MEKESFFKNYFRKRPRTYWLDILYLGVFNVLGCSGLQFTPTPSTYVLITFSDFVNCESEREKAAGCAWNLHSGDNTSVYGEISLFLGSHKLRQDTSFIFIFLSRPILYYSLFDRLYYTLLYNNNNNNMYFEKHFSPPKRFRIPSTTNIFFFSHRLYSSWMTKT